MLPTTCYPAVIRSSDSASRVPLACQGHNLCSPVVQDLPQEVIVKMVRNRPQLRWLRSDLTPENVAMLQQERPEITFVSE